MNTCYTVITGGYDTLKPPRIISEGWEYTVFSDKFIDVPPWGCIVTDKHNRELKIMPNAELFNNITLYVDGSIEIIGNLNKFVKEVPNRYASCKHPHRTNIMQEAEAVIRLKGCSRPLVMQQIDRYIDAGFDEPLAECCVLLRNLNDPVVRRINKLWHSEWLNSCGRDQLSFGYSCWKYGLKPYLFDQVVFKRYFKLYSHS